MTPDPVAPFAQTAVIVTPTNGELPPSKVSVVVEDVDGLPGPQATKIAAATTVRAASVSPYLTRLSNDFNLVSPE